VGSRIIDAGKSHPVLQHGVDYMMIGAVVLAEYQRVTDGRTDRQPIAVPC